MKILRSLSLYGLSVAGENSSSLSKMVTRQSGSLASPPSPESPSMPLAPYHAGLEMLGSRTAPHVGQLLWMMARVALSPASAQNSAEREKRVRPVARVEPVWM